MIEQSFERTSELGKRHPLVETKLQDFGFRCDQGCALLQCYQQGPLAQMARSHLAVGCLKFHDDDTHMHALIFHDQGLHIHRAECHWRLRAPSQLLGFRYHERGVLRTGALG